VRRRGLTFLETLVAGALVMTLAGLAAGAVWQWSRSGRRLERRERALSACEGRLESVVNLPLHLRPGPGRYTAENSSEDLARALDSHSVGGLPLRFELEVEPRPVTYVDYFFEGGSGIRYDDFRLYRLRATVGDQSIELVTLR